MYGKGGTTNEKIIVIPWELCDRIQIRSPSRHYTYDGMGNKVYFRVRDFKVAQQLCDDTYGKGRYKVRTEGLPKTNKEITAR